MSSTSGEKTNAGFCFGLAYNDSYSCGFDSTLDATLCEGVSSAYYVVWVETANGTVGTAFDASDDSEIGTIIQGGTGSFLFDYSQLALEGDCAVVGDVATLCVEET